MNTEHINITLATVLARLKVVEGEVERLRAIITPETMAAPTPKGTQGTMTTAEATEMPLRGWVTPKGEYANARSELRVDDSTFLYKLNTVAFVKGSKKDDSGFTWYHIAESPPDAWVREDVVAFSTEKPAARPLIPAIPVTIPAVPVTSTLVKFPAPFTGYSITNRHGVNGHRGIDLATFDRTPAIISASMNGYVVKTALCGGCGPTPGVRVRSNSFGYGNFVIVAYPLPSGEWLHALYAHLSSIRTMPTATLSDSAIIGNVGSTGDSSGNHLHLETRIGSTRDARWATLEAREVDPLTYFQI